MYIPNTKSLCIVISDEKIFMIPYISLCKTCDAQSGPTFWPQRHNSNKHRRGPLDNTTYLISRPYGFRQEDFFFNFRLENIFLTSVT